VWCMQRRAAENKGVMGSPDIASLPPNSEGPHPAGPIFRNTHPEFVIPVTRLRNMGREASPESGRKMCEFDSSALATGY